MGAMYSGVALPISCGVVECKLMLQCDKSPSFARYQALAQLATCVV